jgi:hypothetical protein
MGQPQIIVVGPKDPVPPGYELLNTTSRSKDWGRAFSPFLLGPVKLYDKFTACNVENGWQYSKVYPEYAGADRVVTTDYWKWAVGGWNNQRAVRYPMGKGKKPLFSLWNGFRLEYIPARKWIYIPLYSQAVLKTDEFYWLKFLLQDKHRRIALWDFDGYNHHVMGVDFDRVINNPNRTMGHAFIIAMLLQGEFSITQGPFWSFRYKENIIKC